MSGAENINFLDAFENAFPDTGFVLDEEGRVVRTFAGPEIDVLLVEDFKNSVGKTVKEVFREQTAETLQRQIERTLDEQSLQTSTYIIETEIGAHSFETRMAPVETEETKPMVVALFRDITARDLYAQYLDEKNRIIYTIQESTQAVSRAETAPDLYESICNVITESAPYQFAWISRYDETGGKLVPEAIASWGETYISRLDLTVTDTDHETHDLPAIQAVRTREPVIIQNFRTDVPSGSWKEAALNEGFNSVAAFPIFDHDDGHLDGVLSVYADRPFAFDFSERELFKELCRDIAFAKRALNARTTISNQKEVLESRNAEWEILNRIVRHDIRNKMAVVLGYAEMLAESDDDEFEHHLQQILDSSQQVIEITKEARDVAEALANGGEVELQDIDIRGTLQTELNQIKETYSDATITIDGELPSATVRANEFLSSVFRNLLSNAIIHNNSETPSVTVSATATDDAVVIDIADNGPGMPDDIQQSATDSGESQPGDDHHREHGVGLRLVTSLIDQFGGKIQVSDNDPTGTVVSIELKRA